MKFKKNFEQFLLSTRFISNNQFFNKTPKCIKLNVKGVFGWQKSEFYYEENGLLSKIIEYDTNDFTAESNKTIYTDIYKNTVIYDLNTTANIHSGDFSALYYQFEFNDIGYPIYSLISIEDKNNKIRNSISSKKTIQTKYEYDSNMNLILISENTFTYRNNSLLTSESRFTKFDYDILGTLLEYSVRSNSDLLFKYKYIYPTNGIIRGSQLINNNFFSNSDFDNYDTLGNIFETFRNGKLTSSFKYEYDKHGNILKKTKTIYSPEYYQKPPFVSETINFEYIY
ncbi:hypothetical protein [Sphingobacterium mizutaii]|uniref:hypothetical protein n=1 Tax=Sphingobacterium mizutaii TaxID=1010 RepID=UPI0016284DEA|nr:hypothetical protein [Sphingobacterium mizutaii]